MSADLLVSDALNHKMSQMVADAGEAMDNNLSSITEDIQESHIKPEEAAVVAREAGGPVLLITHVLPPVSDFLKRPFLKDARAIYDGHLQMANDATLIGITLVALVGPQALGTLLLRRGSETPSALFQLLR